MSRVWLFGDHVDTDQIVPGRYAPYMTSEADLAKYPFIEARPEFAAQAQPGDIIVAGKNFGCGSSREYAPRALTAVGIAAVLAPSFSRIFYRNALNLGLPLYEIDLTQALADGDEVVLVMARSELLVSNPASEDERRLTLPTPPDWLRETWAVGGVLAYYRKYGRLPLGEAS